MLNKIECVLRTLTAKAMIVTLYWDLFWYVPGFRNIRS